MAAMTPDLLQHRDDLWNVNPIITCSAIIDTPPARRVYALVMKRARRQRASLAFWGHPLRGKSFIARLMISKLEAEPQPPAIVYYEVPHTKGRIATELDLLEDLLLILNAEAKPERTLPKRRLQVQKAFYAHSAGSGRLFIIMDEAQELDPDQLCWLKTQINWLSAHRIAVITVMFGQQELKTLSAELLARSRSDLKDRFMECIYELETIAQDEVSDVLTSIDALSRFPPGTDWTYTQFLWPRAYAAGFRLAAQAANLWSAFASFARDTRALKSLGMNVISAVVSELAQATKDCDSAAFAPTLDDWKAAVRASGYVGIAPTRDTARRAAKASA